MQNNQNRLGTFVSKRRQHLGISQGQLARTLGFKSPQFISNIERGEASIPPDRLIKLATTLKVNPQEFIKRHVWALQQAYEAKVFGSKRASPKKTATKARGARLMKKWKK